jgi:hypothetical protein
VLRGSMELAAAPATRALATVRQVDSQGPAQLQGLLRRTALLVMLVGTVLRAGPIPNAQVLVLLVGTRWRILLPAQLPKIALLAARGGTWTWLAAMPRPTVSPALRGSMEPEAVPAARALATVLWVATRQ